MTENNEFEAVILSDFEAATGEIMYGMTNDYMFRAVMQKNNKALRGLVGAVLHLEEKDMTSVEITNPIVLGETPVDKEFRLDINVLLNNKKMINIEMQVLDYNNWPNRSLSYLCRSYDNLSKGKDYTQIQPVIHIGILDFTLFEKYPEFYASYKMMNCKNHNIYTDNFALNVLDLTKIDIATDEDKKYQLDYWARLFKAKTWEEIKTLIPENEYFKEASQTMFKLSADEEIRKRCRDREDYYADLRGMKHIITDLTDTIADKNAEIANKDAEIADIKAENARLEAIVKKLQNKE